MTKPFLSIFLALLLALGAVSASAQTLTGTVKNSTTGKPAAGDDVILLSLGQGMEEAGRTKTDAKGNFSFKLDSARAPISSASSIRKSPITAWLLPERLRSRSKSTTSAKKSKASQVVADIMRFQAAQGQLQVERTFAVNNNSKPPRTQMNEHNLEFYVPDGATITEGQAMTAGGQPVKSAPVPEDNAKSRYAFSSRFAPARRDSASSTPFPTPAAPISIPRAFILWNISSPSRPRSMQFSAAPGTRYQVAPFPGQPDANVEVASNTKLGQPMAFKLSGEGTAGGAGR